MKRLALPFDCVAHVECGDRLPSRRERVRTGRRVGAGRHLSREWRNATPRACLRAKPGSMNCPFCRKPSSFVAESQVVLGLTCTIGGFQLSLPLVVRPVRPAGGKGSLQRAVLGADALATAQGASSEPELSPALQQLRAGLSPDTLASLGECGEPADAAFLQRWCTARKGNLPAARADIEAHAHWRRSFLGPGGVQEGEVASDLAAGRAFFQGLSRDGCPVLILRAARFAEAGGGAAAAQRLICFLMDRAAPTADTGVNPLSQFRVIFDLAGARRGVRTGVRARAHACSRVGDARGWGERDGPLRAGIALSRGGPPPPKTKGPPSPLDSCFETCAQG